jgi:hypothetical protein
VADVDPDWEMVNAIPVGPIADDAVSALRPGQLGLLRMWWLPSGWRVSALHHPDLSVAEVARFQLWVSETAYRVSKYGPEVARLQKRTTDTGWQLAWVEPTFAELGVDPAVPDTAAELFDDQ